MFLDYRIRRLQTEFDVQTALVEMLAIAEKEYGKAYYTNKFHRESCKLVRINSKLQQLKGMLKESK